jgi:hypothetical protein
VVEIEEERTRHGGPSQRLIARPWLASSMLPDPMSVPPCCWKPAPELCLQAHRNSCSSKEAQISDKQYGASAAITKLCPEDGVHVRSQITTTSIKCLMDFAAANQHNMRSMLKGSLDSSWCDGFVWYIVGISLTRKYNLWPA